MITYGITEEIYTLGNDRRVSYGIAVYDSGISTVIASIRDLSPDREAVEELVRLCNQFELSPIHLNDVAEDFLAL